MNGDFSEYFSVNLTSNSFTISTKIEFGNYEKEQNETKPGIAIHFLCGTTNIQTSVTIIFLINVVNNYAPEFSSTSYEIEIPTPLPKGFDITYFMGASKLTALDWDLYNNVLTFAIDGTNLFRVDSDIDSNGLRPVHRVKVITTQNILQIEGDEMSFTLSAIVRAFYKDFLFF
jgi:hypothetical protein